MSTRFGPGLLVEYPGCPGIGRIGALDGKLLRVEFFESVAEPIAGSEWQPASNCRRAMLEPETRAYWRNPDSGTWMAGRVKGTSSGGYFIQFPNTEFDFPIPEVELRVRWDRPVRDPVSVLAAGGNESAFFHDARMPLLSNFIDQRAASASTFAFLSSSVEFYPHQISAALTVLSDLVQRYLLADEVGLGKTIEAGLIIRQTLIDRPRSRITVLTPDNLRRQWLRELVDKFFIEDFPDAQVKVVAHEAPERWALYRGSDLVVVDEAHQLTRNTDPDERVYRLLCDLAHSAPRILLLSATPVMSQHTTQLGLLHLLDPDLYRWTERSAFQRRYDVRSRLADGIYALDPDYTYLLPTTIDGLRELLPRDDTRFAELAGQVLGQLDKEDELKPDASIIELQYRIEALRAHISETYRLHRRIIRHRRDKVLRSDPDVDVMAYEVTGRQAPQWLPISIDAHDAARVAMLEWRSGTWDSLLDDGLADQAAAYSLVLAVLVSRAGGLCADLADAFRWRLHRDPAAADRAGLSTPERELLAAPRVLGAEAAALERLEAHLAAEDVGQDMDGLVNAILPMLRHSKRAVIFCGPGRLASDLVARLQVRFARVRIRELTRQVDSATADAALLEWSSRPEPGSPRQVLVVDESAEDGLNLQIADAVLHLRLPWSPNQFEQRLGRIDRYPGAAAATVAAPARQFLMGNHDADDSFIDAWATLLETGYQVFINSVSTLQDAIAATLELSWLAGLQRGPQGLVEDAGRVQTDLSMARREIDKMDMLESIHEGSFEATDAANALTGLEQDWPTMRSSLLNYTSEGNGGIKLRHSQRKVGEGDREVFDLPGSHPLLAPRQWNAARMRVTPAMAQGAFNRSVALRSPGTRILRRGNPLVDFLAEVIAIDDRGQASAIRRIDPGFTGEPEAYFGFDYIVEADITGALSRAPGRQGTAPALRRRADRILPPFTLKAWVGLATGHVVADPAQLAFLERPYDKRKGDRNYGKERRSDFLNIFGGHDQFQKAAEMSEAVCRRHLAEVTDLSEKCSRAQHQARQQIAIATAQAKARQAAGHLVADSESYMLDVAMTDALVEGLSQPTVRTVAATCVVRCRVERIRHDA